MTTTIQKYPGGLIVRATIPKSVRNNTRKSVRTWRIKCLRPELTAVELKEHLRREVDRWALDKQRYFEQVTGKPSEVIGVKAEPEPEVVEKADEQNIPGI